MCSQLMPPIVMLLVKAVWMKQAGLKTPSLLCGAIALARHLV